MSPMPMTANRLSTMRSPMSDRHASGPVPYAPKRASDANSATIMSTSRVSMALA
jgi:hypothetical protein